MARPATGQTPVRSFRPPQALWAEAAAKAKAEGRSMSDVLIGLLHHYVRQPPKPPAGEPHK